MNEKFEEIINELIKESSKNIKMLYVLMAILAFSSIFLFLEQSYLFLSIILVVIVLQIFIIFLSKKLIKRYKYMLSNYTTNKADVLDKLKSFKHVNREKTKNRIVYLSALAYDTLSNKK